MFCRLLLVTVFCPRSKDSTFGSVLNLASSYFFGGWGGRIEEQNPRFCLTLRGISALLMTPYNCNLAVKASVLGVRADERRAERWGIKVWSLDVTPPPPQIYPHFPLLNILRGIGEGIQRGRAVCAPLPARCQTNGVANQSGFCFTNSFGESKMDLGR